MWCFRCFANAVKPFILGCVCGSCWETSWVKLSFRSWHFKPDCANSPFGQGLVWLWFPCYLFLFMAPLFFRPRDESKGRVQRTCLLECCLARLNSLSVRSRGRESPTDFGALRFSGLSSADNPPDKFAKVHRTSLQMPGSQKSRCSFSNRVVWGKLCLQWLLPCTMFVYPGGERLGHHGPGRPGGGG